MRGREGESHVATCVGCVEWHQTLSTRWEVRVLRIPQTSQEVRVMSIPQTSRLQVPLHPSCVIPPLPPPV